MMKKINALIIAVYFFPTSAISADSLELPELLSNVLKVRNFKPLSSFDVGPDLSSIIGREITVDTIPGEQRPWACSGMPSWSYDIANQFLDFWALGNREKSLEWSGWRAEWSHNQFPVFWGIGLACPRIEKSVGGVGAYGASVPIRHLKDEFIALGSVSQISMPNWQHWKKVLKPEDAKELQGNLKVRVTATISSWSPGNPIICGRKTQNATLANLTEHFLTGCFVAARIRSVSLVHKTTGETVHVFFSDFENAAP